MNSLWQTPAVVLALLSWLSSPADGLGDIAQREAFRRQATQRSSSSLTNLNGAPSEIPPAAVTLGPAEAVPADAGGKAVEAGKPSDPSKDEKPKDENWWRTKMADARTALDRDQLSADALQSRINALKNDSVNLDDPIKQARARQDLGRALDELDRVTKQIDADRKSITALQDEARRANVPAGWIR